MTDLVPFLPGLRVVRGPDWKWGDQDGGEGHVGTVVEVGQPSGSDGGRAVVVQWDCEERPCKYRCGMEGKFDLRVLDSAPTGIGFPSVRCYGCRKEGFSGHQWRCTRCSEYQLCSDCYMADYHSVEHQFNCITSKDGKKVKVLPRNGLKKVEAKGLFVKARVVRGRDWKWRDQDGGRGSVGKVVSIKNWKNETTRSVAEVEWPRTNRTNLYRAGHRGKIDLRVMEPGSGGQYYPEHLPVLGAQYEPAGPKDFCSGDRVKCDVDVEILSLASEVGEGANDQILMLLDHIGTVEEFLPSGELHVRYPNNSLLPVSPEGAYKVSVPLLRRGDVVRIIDDMAEVYSLQKGHGEWVDDMALSVGQLGVVIKVLPSGDVRVATEIRKWLMNPRCLLLVPNETPPPIVDADHDVDLDTRMQLMSLSHANDPNVLVIAAAAGDVSTMRSFLAGAPDKVDVTYQGKTALHVAIEEGCPSGVRLLLEYKANTNLQDKGGEKPLHTCAYVKSLECAKLLLDAGVDVNSRNAKDNTPLMVAAALGHINVLKLFLAQPNIDINAQDFGGKTALHHSISSHRSLSVALLLDAGADPTLFSFLGFAPIHDAAGHGFLVGMEEIVSRYPEHVNFKRMEDENTALHIAAANDKLEVLKHLCTIPTVDINMKNNRTHTPLHCASIEGYGTIIEALVGYGADLNATDMEDNTALHILLIKKVGKPPNEDLTPQIMKVQRDIKRFQGSSSVAHYMTLVCFLVQQGANVQLRNRRGQTPKDMIPQEMAGVLMNFANDIDRGSFHGSLKGSNGSAAVAPPHENRPFQQEVEAVTPADSYSPLPSDASKSPPHLHVAELAPKQNRGNQERTQQEQFTSTSSTVKDFRVGKPSPNNNQSPQSGQPQRANLRMEETLKEKAGFSPHHDRGPSQMHPPSSCNDPVHPAIVRGVTPAAAIGEESEDHADSNKSLPTAKPPGSVSPSRIGSIQSALYETRERRMQKPVSNWSEQQTVADTTKLGINEKPTSTVASVTETESQTTANNCFLCDEEPSNVKFLPCEHVVMCKICAKRTKKCPHCQKTITDKVIVAATN